jgi:hypothetical protein
MSARRFQIIDIGKPLGEGLTRRPEILARQIRQESGGAPPPVKCHRHQQRRFSRG